MGSFVFIRFNGKAIIENRLSVAFQRPVSVRNVGISFPLSLRLDRLQVKDALKVKVVDVMISLPDFLHRQFILSSVKLQEPVLSIKRTKDSEIVLGEKPMEFSSQAESQEEPPQEPAVSEDKSKMPVGLFVKFIEVENGKLHFSDQVSKNKFVLDMKEVSLKARSVAYPLKSQDSKFKLSARIYSDQIPFSGGKVESEGWVNIVGRNMESKAKVIDLNGNVSLAVELNSKNNNMNVKGTMNIGGKETQKRIEEQGVSSVEDFIFGAMGAAGVGVKMDFEFQTKMDDFRIEPVAISGTVGKEESFESIGEGFKKIGEQFEAFGKKFYEENIKSPEEKTEDPQTQPILEKE